MSRSHGTGYYLGFTCFGGPPVHFQIVWKLKYGCITSPNTALVVSQEIRPAAQMDRRGNLSGAVRSVPSFTRSCFDKTTVLHQSGPRRLYLCHLGHISLEVR